MPSRSSIIHTVSSGIFIASCIVAVTRGGGFVAAKCPMYRLVDSCLNSEQYVCYWCASSSCSPVYSSGCVRSICGTANANVTSCTTSSMYRQCGWCNRSTTGHSTCYYSYAGDAPEECSWNGGLWAPNVWNRGMCGEYTTEASCTAAYSSSACGWCTSPESGAFPCQQLNGSHPASQPTSCAGGWTPPNIANEAAHVLLLAIGVPAGVCLCIMVSIVCFVYYRSQKKRRHVEQDTIMAAESGPPVAYSSMNR